MDESLIALLLVIVLILTCVLIAMVASIRGILCLMQSNQSLFMDRLNSILGILRKEPGEAHKPIPVATPVNVQPAPSPIQPPAPETATLPPPLPAAAFTVTAAPPPPRPATVQPKATPPKPPSKFEETARDILSKIWNWILVGEEHRPEHMTAEYAVASVWLLRLSMLAIVAGLSYFLKWSIEREIIGPHARVAMSFLAGIGMLLGGMKLLNRRYHVIAQGLLGGGLLVLYLSAYAMGPKYHLFQEHSTLIAFGVMILVTVAAGFLAVRTNSQLVALLGLLGGYLTPIVLRTETPNLPAFYAYLLLMGLGILGIAVYRRWHLLNYLAFIFNYVLFFLSLNSYHKETDFPIAISFLSAFFVIHSSLVYLNNILRGRRSTTLEVIHLAANAGVFAWAGYNLIAEASGRPYPAILSAGLAAFYIAHVFAFLRRRIEDRPLLNTLIALAGAFTVWTLPLAMEKETLTIAFSLLALMFLWLGGRLGSSFMSGFGQAVYAVVFFRLLFMDVPRNYGMHPADVPLDVYWKQMLDRLWTFGVAIGSIAAAFFVQRRAANRAANATVSEANDLQAAVKPQASTHIFHWVALLAAFLCIHLELNTMLGYWEPLRPSFLTSLWCIMALFLLWRYFTGSRPAPLFFGAACVFAIAAIVKVFAIDLGAWHFDWDDYIYTTDYSLLFAGARAFDFGQLIILTAFLAWMFRSREPAASPAFGYSSLVILFVYATFELNSALHCFMPAFQAAGISVLWAVFAIAFVVAGIWKNLTPLRYAGLVLFCVVIGKVILSDLKHMEIIYKVIAFMVVGVLLLAGSYAYIRSSGKFLKPGKKEDVQ